MKCESIEDKEKTLQTGDCVGRYNIYKNLKVRMTVHFTTAALKVEDSRIMSFKV